MKTLLSIALAFACLGLGYQLGKRDQLEKNRAEIHTIARDYAKCLEQIEAQRDKQDESLELKLSQLREADRIYWKYLFNYKKSQQ